MATFAALAYHTVRHSVMRAAEVRLTSLAERFAPSVAPGLIAQAERLARVAAEPAIAAQLAAGGGRTIPAALEALRAVGPDTGAVVAIELRDSTGRRVLSMGGQPDTHRSSDQSAPRGSSLDTASVSQLYLRDSLVVYEIRGNLIRDGHVVGQVVQVRSAETSKSASINAMSALIGADGALLLGNADGSLWTDLRGVSQGPRPGAGIQQYTRNGREKLAAARRIPGTPLALAFELDASRVQAPLHSLLVTYAMVAALIVLLGAALGWWLSRGITRPLTALTGAAEAISAGDLERLPDAATRNDEIGRLSRAFATMTDNVRAARDNLEHQVAERTAELRAAQEENVRQERLATLGQLSSSVGHELRNPLGVMSNAVYFLNATLQSPTPKTTEYLGILKAQIALSEKIVADLLDFARVKAPQRRTVPVAGIVEEQLARTPMPANVRVEQRVDPAVEVNVDPIQIGQVVLNLLTNAAQSMDGSGGTLRIEAARDNGTIHLSVRDTGVGIAPEHLSRVFEPLFTTKARGIGLGLSVSRSLAQANGGALSVESAVGVGSAFTLELPAVS